MRRAAYDAALAGLSSALPLTMIVSLGGMGKSTLAQVLARDCLEGRAVPPFAAAVWVSDHDHPGTTSLSTLLDEVARVLDYPGIAALSAVDKRRAIEDLLGREPTLLVLDNAETVRDRAVLEWLAALPVPSKALVTSRTLPPAGIVACVVELAPMNSAEAQALIGERVQQSSLRRVPGATAQLAPLAAATGGNPKAIELAVSLVQHRPLHDVLADLDSGREQLFFADLFANAWALLDASARRVLLSVPLFPTTINAEALAFCADLPPLAAQRVLSGLVELSLLDTERADLLAAPRYSVHPLVRAFASARLAEQPDLEAQLRARWLHWCIELGESVGFCWFDLDRLELLDREHETLQTALEWAAAQGQDRETLRLCEGVRYYYNVRGLWDERRLRNYRYRSLAAERSGDVSELVLALAQFAEIRSKQAGLPEAEEGGAALLGRAEAIAASSDLHPDARFELGHARGLAAHARGDLVQAEAHWRALLPLAEHLGGQKYVINRRWLATCLLDQGRSEEAATLYRSSLADAEMCNDTRSITGNSLKLAAIDLAQGDLAAAALALARCHEVAHRHQDRRRLAECHRLSAELRRRQGDEIGWREEVAQALNLFERMGMQREVAELRGSI
jgi:tetratricopeptide (TPR) repeat protein